MLANPLIEGNGLHHHYHVGIDRIIGGSIQASYVYQKHSNDIIAIMTLPSDISKAFI